MVVGAGRLERGAVGVDKGPARCPEDVSDLEILERPRFNDPESGCIELVRAEAASWLIVSGP
jgi:hypothetical protein